jgi:hypothetical protein
MDHARPLPADVQDHLVSDDPGSHRGRNLPHVHLPVMVHGPATQQIEHHWMASTLRVDISILAVDVATHQTLNSRFLDSGPMETTAPRRLATAHGEGWLHAEDLVHRRFTRSSPEADIEI